MDGPVRVRIGSLSGLTENDFIVETIISGFAFTGPEEGVFIESAVDFTLTSQPEAERILFEILGHPQILLPDDTTPDTIKVTISPTVFPANGGYILQATAIAGTEQVSVTRSFFVEKLKGDFNGDGVVNEADLDFLRTRLWLTPGDPGWIPYLDANRDGVIDELDAHIVGYNYGLQ